MFQRLATRAGVLRAGVAAALALGISGCGGASAPAPEVIATVPAATAPAVAQQATTVLEELGASRLYVMAGDYVLKSGLGVLSTSGLEPATTTPQIRLLSNVSGNGHTVVVGAAGALGGFMIDGAYQLVGDRLKTLAKPSEQMYSPAVAADGTIAAVGPDGGFFLRAPGTTTWKRDHRLAHVGLVAVTWDRTGTAYTVARSGTPRARLWQLRRNGPARILRALPCVTGVGAAPTGIWAATDPERGRPGCTKAVRSRLIDLTGHRPDRLLPAGWDPLTWARDSSSLLLARGHQIAVWQVASGRFTDVADVGVRIWMAAPIWDDGTQ